MSGVVVFFNFPGTLKLIWALTSSNRVKNAAMHLRERVNACMCYATRSCNYDLCKWPKQLWSGWARSLHQSHELNHLLMCAAAADGQLVSRLENSVWPLKQLLSSAGHHSSRRPISCSKKNSRQDKKILRRSNNNDAGPEWEVKHVPTPAKSLLHHDSRLPWLLPELLCFIYSCLERKFSPFHKTRWL